VVIPELWIEGGEDSLAGWDDLDRIDDCVIDGVRTTLGAKSDRDHATIFRRY
jgi:hypothetical protein